MDYAALNPWLESCHAEGTSDGNRRCPYKSMIRILGATDGSLSVVDHTDRVRIQYTLLLKLYANVLLRAEETLIRYRSSWGAWTIAILCILACQSSCCARSSACLSSDQSRWTCIPMEYKLHEGNCILASCHWLRIAFQGHHTGTCLDYWHCLGSRLESAGLATNALCCLWRYAGATLCCIDLSPPCHLSYCTVLLGNSTINCILCCLWFCEAFIVNCLWTLSLSYFICML